jgi:outer membrane protein assembly factor BamE (lipoprotein component of BamABCDE complex)
MLKRVASALLSLFASTVVFGQSIDERVRDLERRVGQLKSQSGNQSTSAASRAQIVSGQDGWKRQENWRSLKRGMTEADVKGLLGDAHKVDTFGSFSIWHDNPLGAAM